MYGKSLEDFEESLLKKYDGQLRLYTYAASKIFEVSEKEIETQLIHFYL